ncbi:hypothetical protein [Polaromonas sp. YR568]|uniref:hypothetical protein n=1 Tax=Polaromonas sp. YR568 TaxID=1855301 RepID=UPI0031379948
MTQTTSQVEAGASNYEAREAVRQAGGIIHRDGNIFFTNTEQFLAAYTALRAELASQQEVAAPVEELRRMNDKQGWSASNDSMENTLYAAVGDGETVFAIVVGKGFDGDEEKRFATAMDAILAAARVPGASPAPLLDALNDYSERWPAICNAAYERACQTDAKAAQALRPAMRAILQAGAAVATPHGGAGGAGVMDARPGSFHSDSGECDRVQGAESCQVNQFSSRICERGTWGCRTKHGAAILAKGGDQGEGK